VWQAGRLRYGRRGRLRYERAVPAAASQDLNPLAECTRFNTFRCHRCFKTSFVKNRFLIRAVPILIAVLIFGFQRCSSEKIVNEAGRTVRLGLSTQQESTMGLQAYQQVLAQSQTIS
jgi:hypothetical protein